MSKHDHLEAMAEPLVQEILRLCAPVAMFDVNAGPRLRKAVAAMLERFEDSHLRTWHETEQD